MTPVHSPINGFAQPYYKRIPSQDKEILDFIWRQQDGGASVKKVAANLRIHPQRVASKVHELEKIGEVFTKGDGVYCSTAWAMEFDPKPIVEKLHEELERALSDPDDPPERVFDMLDVYHAARSSPLNLTRHEAWRLVHKRLMKEMG